MRYLLASLFCASFALPALAQVVPPLAVVVPPPAVTFTQADLAQHDEKVSTMAVLNYMAQQATEKAKASDAKISAAFAPKPQSASTPEGGAK